MNVQGTVWRSIMVSRLVVGIAALAMSAGASFAADITVGFVTSLSGPGASIGIPYEKGVLAGHAYADKVGAVKIKLIRLDDASDPSAATRNARKLVEEEKVDVLMGTSGVPGTIAMAVVAAETKTPIISPAIDEFNKRSAPLPAIGVIGRAYPLPQLAVNFSVTGFKLPNVDPKYQAKYFDWDINGTVNVTNNFGVQVGWRKITNFMVIEKDSGDVKFQGVWFGAAVRY